MIHHSQLITITNEKATEQRCSEFDYLTALGASVQWKIEIRTRLIRESDAPSGWAIACAFDPVEGINQSKALLKIRVDIFGRYRAIKLSFTDVEKIEFNQE